MSLILYFLFFKNKEKMFVLTTITKLNFNYRKKKIFKEYDWDFLLLLLLMLLLMYIILEDVVVSNHIFYFNIKKWRGKEIK